MQDQDLVKALRCTSAPGGPVGDCKKCPFCRTEHIGADLAKIFGQDYWERCGVNGIAIAAADRIANQDTHILALQKEIEGLRSQNKQLREAAALVTKESAELLERRWIPVEERLPELQSWGASEVVLGWTKSENAPPLNKPHNLTLCIYCDNGIWSMPGRYVAITHWMPLPEPPEEER